MRLSVLLLVSCVGAPAFVNGQTSRSQGVTPEDFANVKTLKAAVEVMQDRFKQDGKPEYSALISEARIREAVRNAVRSYEARLQEAEKQRPGSQEYFLKHVKPACLTIANKGDWTPRYSFFSFYSLGDLRRDIVYHGLGLRLRIETPDAKSKAFALPVLDLYFGRFAD